MTKVDEKHLGGNVLEVNEICPKFLKYLKALVVVGVVVGHEYGVSL